MERDLRDSEALGRALLERPAGQSILQAADQLDKYHKIYNQVSKNGIYLNEKKMLPAVE